MLTVLLGAATSATAGTAPDAQTIRRTARDIVNRSEFQIRPVYSNRAIWDFIERIFGPIIRFFAGLWDISPILAWVVIIALILLGALLVLHIVYTFQKAIARRAEIGGLLNGDVRKNDPAELERQAEDAAIGQQYVTAVRLLFRAALLRIAQREKRELRPGTTNREYLRRYGRSTFADSLRKFVEVIDAKWYGLGVCDADDYRACRLAHSNIRSAIEVSYAHGA